MEVQIEYLADRPDCVPILANWLFDEWGYRFPEGNARKIEENLRQRLNRDSLPLALVAVHDREPVGTVSLKMKEVEIRPQYEHWLGTLYVHDPNRGRGVGSRLVQAAAGEARRLDLHELYLYTRHQRTEAWYAKLGWEILERLAYRGRAAVIMKRSLAGGYGV